VRGRFSANAIWPGSDPEPTDPWLARDQDDNTKATIKVNPTAGLKNGIVYSVQYDLPEDVGTLDAVWVRLRLNHSSGPPAPGFLENYHAVYISYNAGTDWALVHGAENGLAIKPNVTYVEVPLAVPPTIAEWPAVQLLVHNWVDFTGSQVPTIP
jgi:hypothetical protein